MKRKLLSLLLATALLLGCAFGENTEAPRDYFPYHADLDTLPDNLSLPNLFEFFDASADPDGSGYVETAEDWEARRSELKDLLEYYEYGNRMDPLKSDTQITGIIENYQWNWADGVMNSAETYFGYTALPNLPEGAVTMNVLDFTAYGYGLYYSGITPDLEFVYHGDGYDMPGELADWKDGDTWEQHGDAASYDKLPVLTIEMTIKDTNPENAAYVSEAAAEGIKATFSLRVPMEAPVVDGVVRDGSNSRYGAGYPIVVVTGSLSEEQIVTLNNNGYAYISVNDSCDPDQGQISKYEMLYPTSDPVVHNDNTIKNEYAVDSGNLMQTAWLASRALDALENYTALSDAEKTAINADVIIPAIDVYSSAVTGCSNNGKRAMVCGVFDNGNNGDTRFDIICPSDSGAGGASGIRYSTEGQLFSYQAPETNSGATVIEHNFAYGLNETTQRAIQNTSEDQWFLDRAQILTVRPDLADNMPVDAHSLIAAFATASENRYFITWTAEAQDAWISTPATVINTWAAREVYEFLGQGDNVAVIVRDQAHANQDRDLADLIAIMDKEYYGAETLTRKHFDTLADETGLYAIDGSGTILPEKTFESVRAMERNPYYIPSVYLNWSRPGKYYLYTETNSVTENIAVSIDFYTDADAVELTLTDGETKLMADAVDGVATISISADQAKAGQYVATTIGDKDAKSIEICGWTVNDALRHAVTDNSALGHDVGSGIAFTTPLVNYADEDDAVELYMNGIRLAADIYDYDNKVYLEDGTVVPQSGYLQPYGASLLLYADTEGYKVGMGEKVVFSVRNAKIEALKGFVISVDVELEKYCPSGTRQRWKTTYNTDNTQTPVWEPDLLQNTPASGLPEGETRWPMLGNWKSDYDENGQLKDIDTIRPVYSTKEESTYNAVITLAASDLNGFTLNFSEPVNKNDFAIAINTVAGYTYGWDEACMNVTITYDAPVAEDAVVTVFVFRSVDSDGDMIGGPVRFDVASK